MPIDVLLITVIVILATSKVTIQAKYAKSAIQTSFDSISFNAYNFSFATLLLIPIALILKQYTTTTILFALVNAVLTIAFQFFYNLSMKKGPMGISVAINSLAMIFPIMFSAIVYGEPFGIFRIIATILICCAFVLNIKKDNNQRANTLWIIYISIVMIVNALLNIWQKIYSHDAVVNETIGLVAFTYLFSSIFSWIIIFMYKFKHQNEKLKVDGQQLKYSVIIASCLCLHNILNIYAISTIDGTYYFPLTNVLCLVASMLIGFILYKEKLSIPKIIALLFAIIAIIIVNF